MDTRFGRPAILDDHCWAFGTDLGDPKALSLLTTYGLRASRMYIFPQFSMEDLLVQDPAKFYSPPIVSFSSACLVNITFSPFPSLDVEYRAWVPDSHVLVGQVNCVNSGQNMLTVEVDWRVHLQPLQGGSPMKHAQAGMNSILQGECANLHPVFYLTGGALPSLTDFPGLGNKILLMPGTNHQGTWAVASLATAEASTQQARQFSSSMLELEQLKIEMADKSLKVQCSSAQAALNETLQRSQDRAFQLLMPALQKHSHNTYVADRSPDLGNHASENILEVQPEWSGQTLPEIYLLSQNLLPGRPEVVKGLLLNFLSIQQQDGRIDLRASANHSFTGHSSLPILATLVSDLQQYLHDKSWLTGIYPQLLAFIKNWLRLDGTGNLLLSALTHPLQLGFEDISPDTNPALVELWVRLSQPQNILLVSFLFREVSELLHIAHLINIYDDLEWLETVRERLKDEAASLIKDTTGKIQPSAYKPAGLILTSFRNDGLPRLKHNLPHPGRIYLRLDHHGILPAELCCSISGFTAGTYFEKIIKACDFQPVGSSYCYVSPEEFAFIESISIRKMPEGAYGEIGLVDLAGGCILDQMACYAGMLTPKDANKIASRARVKSFLAEGGISVFPASETAPNLMLPAYLAAMIVDGLVRYGKFELAEQLFRHHFLRTLDKVTPDLSGLSRCATMRIHDLVPTRLFLKLHGLMKLSNREIIIAHYDRNQSPVTVQYNKLELLIRHNLTEVRMQSGEVVYLNQPGTNRILLE